MSSAASAEAAASHGSVASYTSVALRASDGCAVAADHGFVDYYFFCDYGHARVDCRRSVSQRSFALVPSARKGLELRSLTQTAYEKLRAPELVDASLNFASIVARVTCAAD